MRAVIQRVSRAEVRVEGEVIGRVERGVLALVGVGKGDGADDAAYLADKIVGLRIFEDDAGKMNRDVKEAGGAVLAVSQFTLLGDARKGRRPGFTDALEPEPARALFEELCERCRTLGVRVETGRFRAHMEVELVNDGPVTILLDSKRLF